MGIPFPVTPDAKAMEDGWFLNGWENINNASWHWTFVVLAVKEERKKLEEQKLFPNWDAIEAHKKIDQWSKKNGLY